MLRSSCACSSVRSLDRPTLESNSGAAASTASTSPSSKDAISASSIWSTASSRRPEVAAKRSATCFERAIGNSRTPALWRLTVHGVGGRSELQAKSASDGAHRGRGGLRAQLGGTNTDPRERLRGVDGRDTASSGERLAQLNVAINERGELLRVLHGSRNTIVSQCSHTANAPTSAHGRTKAESAVPVWRRAWSQWRTWPAARPPSARGCPEPGAGMPSFSSTASVSSIPFSSSVRSLVSARCEKPALSKSARVKEALRTPWAARSDGDGCKTMSVTVSPPVRRCARSVSPE
eukprot:scaffold84763_cov31-Tisochrysis_lutea.AAC.1